MANAALKVADATGNQQEIDKAQESVDQAAIDAGYERAAAASANASSLESQASASALSAIADGQYTAAEMQAQGAAENRAVAGRVAANASYAEAVANEQAIKAVKEKTKADKNAADAAKEPANQARAGGGLISNFYNSAISPLAALSEKAVAEFKRMRGEIVPTTTSYKRWRKKPKSLTPTFAMSAWGPVWSAS